MSIDIVEPRSIFMKSRRHKHIQNLSTGATWQCVGIKAAEISRPQHLQKPVSSLKNFRNGLILYTDKLKITNLGYFRNA